ncbi:MAG: SRPBCC family protein [Verrucomicrobiae bacterium]|nr:SRPBCC family protein [Verrucomicrobiae bacterium]
MIKKILIGLAAVIALVLLLAAFQPSEFRVERSRSIAASPEVLFEQVNNHRNFAAWNPWEKMDPTSQTTYSGPESGVGAKASWAGDKVGEGAATITESKPGEFVRQRMDWIKPMEGVSTVDFTFVPDGDKTKVTWAMYGENNYVGKLMSLFMDCESMCGPPFEQGLADLEKVVTEAPKASE